jgi:CRISPR-associated exonuclease Cas4
MSIDEMYIKGVQVNYYFVCKTKLWLFSHNITMEHESDLVKLGKLLHLEVFERDEKEVHIGSIAIDVVKKSDIVEIKEVKKSDKLEIAHKYQTLYYLYYLKKLGINAKATISYPKLKKNVELELNDEIEREIERILEDIERICRGRMPKPEYSSQCRNCAYFEFCFA